MVPGLAVPASPGKALEMQNLRPHPRLQIRSAIDGSQKCVFFTSPPIDPNAYENLRTTRLQHKDLAWAVSSTATSVYRDCKWLKDITYVSPALKCNTLGVVWKNTKKQDYLDTGIATLSVNAITYSLQLYPQKKTICQIPKCKIYQEIDWNIRAL